MIKLFLRGLAITVMAEASGSVHKTKADGRQTGAAKETDDGGSGHIDFGAGSERKNEANLPNGDVELPICF